MATEDMEATHRMVTAQSQLDTARVKNRAEKKEMAGPHAGLTASVCRPPAPGPLQQLEAQAATIYPQTKTKENKNPQGSSLK